MVQDTSPVFQLDSRSKAIVDTYTNEFRKPASFLSKTFKVLKEFTSVIVLIINFYATEELDYEFWTTVGGCLVSGIILFSIALYSSDSPIWCDLVCIIALAYPVKSYFAIQENMDDQRDLFKKKSNNDNYYTEKELRVVVNALTNQSVAHRQNLCMTVVNEIGIGMVKLYFVTNEPFTCSVESISSLLLIFLLTFHLVSAAVEEQTTSIKFKHMLNIYVAYNWESQRDELNSFPQTDFKETLLSWAVKILSTFTVIFVLIVIRTYSGVLFIFSMVFGLILSFVWVKMDPAKENYQNPPQGVITWLYYLVETTVGFFLLRNHRFSKNYLVVQTRIFFAWTLKSFLQSGIPVGILCIIYYNYSMPSTEPVNYLIPESSNSSFCPNWTTSVLNVLNPTQLSFNTNLIIILVLYILHIIVTLIYLLYLYKHEMNNSTFPIATAINIFEERFLRESSWRWNTKPSKIMYLIKLLYFSYVAYPDFRKSDTELKELAIQLAKKLTVQQEEPMNPVLVPIINFLNSENDNRDSDSINCIRILCQALNTNYETIMANMTSRKLTEIGKRLRVEPVISSRN